MNNIKSGTNTLYKYKYFQLIINYQNKKSTFFYMKIIYRKTQLYKYSLYPQKDLF